MYSRTVIALRIILEDQLPICPHVVLNPFRRAQLRQIPVRKFSCQRREPFLQRRRTLRQTNEDEPFPKRKVHGVQRIIGLIKTWDLVHVRRADQSTVEPVRPRVIRALNHGRMPARVLFKSRPAMTTHVVKPANGRSLITNNDQRFVRDLRDKIVTRSSKLALVPNQYPVFRKNLLLLLRKNLRRNEVLLLERLRPRS